MRQNIIIAQKLALCVTMVLLSVTTLFAQSFTVKGTVKDDTGEALVGVNVWIQDTQVGTITNVNGEFEINAPNPNATLVTSYIGMEGQEVALNGRSRVNIVMSYDASIEVEEIQVVAYGTQTKKTVTGAISSMKSEELLKSAANDIPNALAGALPGVSTIQTSGMPGETAATIYIRGSGSLTDSGSTPLILVDGVERDFSQLDANEIADISILKDASATAVFGVRGANGVILVTTRRGESGKASVSFTSQVGVSTPTRVFEMADSYTFASVYNEVYMSEMGTQPFSDKVVEAFRTNSDPIIYPSVNWVDEAMKDYALQTKENITISGGTDNVRYFVSLGYLYEDGLFEDIADDFDSNYDYTRYNYRANLDINLTKSTIVKVNIGGVATKQHKMIEPSGYGPLSYLYSSYPFAGAGIIDGELYISDASRFGSFSLTNMGLSRMLTGYEDQSQNTLQLDVAIEQQLDFITEGLKFSIQGSYNSEYSATKSRYKKEIEYLVPYYKSEMEGMTFEADSDSDTFDKTIVTQVEGYDTPLSLEDVSSSKGRDWYLQASFNYDKKIGDHSIGALALFNQSKEYYPSTYSYIPLGYMGLVGRVTYSYRNRYLVDANVGYNGSENFAAGSTRYGCFPAISLGWVASDEDFLRNDNLYLKIRGSYGLVGNDQGISRFLYLPSTYTTDQSVINFGGSSTEKNYYYTTVEGIIGNSDVSWEKALKYNIGFDATLWDKLTISADYFKEERSDILITSNTTPSVGAISLPAINMGRVDNQGYEVMMSYNTRINDFRMNLTGTVTYSKNKIIEMDESVQEYDYMMKTGNSTGTVLGYVFERFYSEDDFDASGELIGDQAKPTISVQAGDPKYEDLNSDGFIDSYDMKYIGYGDRPEYVFGFNTQFAYKRWSLSMQWTAATNVDRNFNGLFRNPFSTAGNFFQYLVDERWTPETAETATMPRFTIANSTYSYANSTLWLMDASYIRLKNVMLEYSFKGTDFAKKAGMTDCSVYISAYNPITIDGIKVTDPEASTSSFASSSTTQYPLTKIYNLGVKINF